MGLNTVEGTKPIDDKNRFFQRPKSVIVSVDLPKVAHDKVLKKLFYTLPYFPF